MASPPVAGEYAQPQSPQGAARSPAPPTGSPLEKICCSKLFQEIGHKDEGNSPHPSKKKSLSLGCSAGTESSWSQLLMWDLARLLATFLALFPGPESSHVRFLVCDRWLGRNVLWRCFGAFHQLADG